MLEESRSVEHFDFNAGHLCLDFINTLSDRFLPGPHEVLDTYLDILTWSQGAHSLNAEQAARLQSLAEQQPGFAEHKLHEIKQTRALLFGIFSAIAEGEEVSNEQLQTFNLVLSQTLPYLGLSSHATGFAWSWHAGEEHLELPLWYCIRDAAELLVSPDLNHVRICASERCDWLFLDTSKNHSRRWCDMKICGNRAKARRYYGRQKSGQET